MALESSNRLTALRKLLMQGELSTQDELREELERMKFVVTQSTISRDLRRIGAVKATDASGQTVYRLPDELSTPVELTSGLENLVLDIQHNGSMIVILTSPGSASLVARHLDHAGPDEVLGTIAGDDTIFVAPASVKSIAAVTKAIRKLFFDA